MIMFILSSVAIFDEILLLTELLYIYDARGN